MFVYQLCIVFVRCHHIHIKLIFIDMFGYSAHHIICLISIDFQDIYIVGLYYILNNGDSSLISSGVFSRCALYSLYSSCLKVGPGGSNTTAICEGLLSKNLFKSIYKAKNGRCVKVLRVYSRVSNECIRTIDECISIEEEKFFLIIILEQKYCCFVYVVYQVRVMNKTLLEYLIECKVTNKCCYQTIYS